MGILQNHFYHSTISTYLRVFGAIFDNIKIKRGANKYVEVPISWASGQKYNVRLEQNPDPNEVRFKNVLPRMSYEMTGMVRDTTRVKNKFHKISDYTEGVNQVNTQYMRVPYIFSIRLDVKVQYFDDLCQIMEQIVVFFNPTLQVVVKDNPDINGQTALTITMTDTPFEDNFEGSFQQSREVTASFNFQLEGFLYMPTNEAGNLITRIEINYHDLDTEELVEQDVITPDE